MANPRNPRRSAAAQRPGPVAHTGRPCETCGAPPEPGLAACSYCHSAYPGLAAGVACPRCRAVNVAGQTACASCQQNLTRACVFCQAVSPLDLPACVRCREPFEGAEARLQARLDERKRQEYMKMASQGMNTVVQVARSPAGEKILSSLMDILTSR